MSPCLFRFTLPHLLLATIAFIALPVHAQVHTAASAVRLYQSATNDPNRLGTSYANGFDVGSYAKNYAMVTLVFFDISALVPSLMGASEISISVKLNSVESTPRPLNIDYLGTFSDTSASFAKYSAPALVTFTDLLTDSATPGNYAFDVTATKTTTFTNAFAAFRFYQTGYVIGDSVSREYHFSPTLADTQLATTIPEPTAISFLVGGAAFVLGTVRYKRATQAPP